uniref:Uncharacterized protein n=1 Tax=Rhizophora mucronata TaxID=61149 RepID=A0A2P2Q7K7_RHIMU
MNNKIDTLVVKNLDNHLGVFFVSITRWGGRDF